nr:hypothetical protein [Tanacetum cinerariifolium]
GNTLHWQWELILPVGTLSWQWECLVHFIPNKVYLRLSVCLLCRPIRKKGCTTWDGGKSTWGDRARGFGTVLVCVSVHEKDGEGE